MNHENHAMQTPSTSSSVPDNAAAAPARRGNRILMGVGALTLAAIVAIGYWFFFLRGTVFTDDARLSGHLVDVAPEISGRLIDVAVREGESVRSGDVLFRLDPATEQVSLNRAEAALDSAKAAWLASQAQYDKAVNGSRPEEIKAAEATVKRLRNDEDLAQLELGRVEQLTKEDAAPQDRLDRARAALESARQNRESAAQNLALLQQGSRKEDIDAAKANEALAKSRVAEAESTLQKARRDLELCSVRAPFDGAVVRRWLDPGAMLAPGQPVVSVFDPATLRVDANIEEKYLNRVRVGNEVDIDVDAYPSLHLKGRLTDILRATNSKFSLIPSEGVAGTFIKVTQRVPLRISVTAPADLHLGPGLSVEVKIRTGTVYEAAPGERHAR